MYRSRDVRLLLLMRGLRGLGYGFLNTALGLYLIGIGYSLLQVGLAVTVAGFSSAMLILVSGILADRVGKKIFLVLSSLLMAALGAIYSLSTVFPILLVGAALGGAGSAGGGVPGGGPFGPSQQALLADKVKDEERNAVFSINAFVGTVLFSIGAVLGGLPDLLSSFGLDRLLVYRILFLVFMTLGFLMSLLSYFVQEARPRRHRPRQEDVKLIGKFTLTAALNGLGFGFLPLPLLTLWFRLTFDTSESSISLMVGAFTVVSAFSFFLSPKLAKRIGAIRTVVYTRIIGVILLASLPMIPFFSIASVVYVLTGIFVSLGMPLWQSYMMGVVESEERATAVGVTSGLGWGIPYATSPTISSYIMQEVNSSMPIYISAALQTSSNAAYYVLFHKVRPPEETR